MKVIIILLVCFFYSFPANAQDCLNSLSSNILYHDPNEIINGTKWISEKRYSGTPFLFENYWPKTDLIFNGYPYRGIQLNYDILNEQVIIFTSGKGNEKYIVIDKQKLSEFSYNDSLSGRKRTYVRGKLPLLAETVFYEKVQLKKVQLFIRPMKQFKATSSESNDGVITDYFQYYLDKGNGLENFKSKKQLMNLLISHRTEMKKYIRKKNLSINNKHPEDIINTIEYFESIDK